MKKIKIYHNYRCSKSRQVLSLINQVTTDIEIIDYIKKPLLKSELLQILKELNMHPYDLLRKNEADYKMQVKGKELNDIQLVDLMIQYPRLIERPIVVYEGKAIVARPPELVHAFLEG